MTITLYLILSNSVKSISKSDLAIVGSKFNGWILTFKSFVSKPLNNLYAEEIPPHSELLEGVTNNASRDSFISAIFWLGTSIFAWG